VQGLYSASVLNGPQSLGIRDYLDKTEMKIKDAQIRKLQGKVKQSQAAETNLKSKMKEINQNDAVLVEKLRNSHCFGQITLYKQARHAFRIDVIGDLQQELRQEFDDMSHSLILN
jgi:hypothetical protein